MEMVIALILFNLVHFAADFTHLSTPWMLSAKRFGKPVLPIAAHALLHTTLFLLVGLCIAEAWAAIVVALIQFITHGSIDVLKGRINARYASLQSPANPYHWYVFGFDQLLHQLVIIYSAYLLNK
ncbi:hypothetical protein BWI93_19190 [Siphonobacter sp. BAB-5385]|uniref:DUF3307 domain-containing protein n=1 Tax=Siphonobacter sp. BAB-5385 TaxID=1864822 RepID=UPI000B9E4143|nr:DUF3307 domain-containing protein [Siphonobacter sp. BAB-5385]OZI06606.1 hypothetical protein BWI93_19190 [Siphonobacter sp. BAB-5385]